MERNRANEKCEWKAVAYDEELRQKFQQFANTKEIHDSEQIEYIDMRGQRHPNLYSPPDITGPALYRKEDSHSSGLGVDLCRTGQRLPQKWWAQCEAWHAGTGSVPPSKCRTKGTVVGDAESMPPQAGSDYFARPCGSAAQRDIDRGRPHLQDHL